MTNPLWKQIPPFKIPNTQHHLIGYSVAAKNTCFYVPEMQIMLDAGLEHEFIPEHVFITHGHSDHSKSIPQSIIQLTNAKEKQNKKIINIYVPLEIVDYVKNYIYAFYTMSKNNPHNKSHLKYKLIGVKPGERINVIINNKKHIVEVIKCFHTVPCVGYGFIETRKRLKEEYKGKEGKELAVLKKSGVEIMEEFEFPLFCYLGDTNEWVVKDHTLEKYNTIMIECSFITPDQIEQARKKRHIYIEKIEDFIKNHTTKTFILYHFSSRYDKEEIEAYFKSHNYTNVVIWV